MLICESKVAQSRKGRRRVLMMGKVRRLAGALGAYQGWVRRVGAQFSGLVNK